jgi:ectoine hydroxylase-related dioxygenase (phytanoyl-CoA dioxygenase family)
MMLTQQQRNFYNENGYLLAEGQFTLAEAGAFRREAHDLIERLSQYADINPTWGSARLLAEGTKLLHCHNVQFYSAVFTRLLIDERLTGAAADLIGSPNVQLHHNKLFIKPPEKGSPFPMHQDYPYFPHDRHTMLAAVIHFDDAPLEKGCIRVVPGSHKRGAIDHDPQGGFHLPFDQYPLESSQPCPARAGDVLFFNYLTIHGSGVNLSQAARTTLLVQMRDPEDKPTMKTHESRGQGMMLRGYDPTALPPEAQRSM